MKFSYNWLQSYFKKKLPRPEKLAEILTLHFAEVEKVEKAGGDFVLDIDVRPNRAGDCLSHKGIAAEISAILNLKIKNEKWKLKESKKIRVKDFVSVKTAGRGLCVRYTARVVSGVKVGASPKWMQDRLLSCGLRPVNNAVDCANYVMLETGQPLHVFDGDKIENKNIAVRLAKPRERIVTLDGGSYELTEDILVIADSKKPLAIAGIKGGKPAEVGRYSKIIIIESANFSQQVVRRGSQKINLRTDASLRFEHGIDPNLTEFAANRAAYLLCKIAGGKIASGLIDIYPKKNFPKEIKLDLKCVKDLLGIDISQSKMGTILKNLGFKIKKDKLTAAESWKISVPTRRLDILIKEDIIEEIGRIYGYEKIPVLPPKTSLVAPGRNLDIFWEDMARDILKEAGFTEIYNYCFVSEDDRNIFGGGNLIEIENPMSADQKYLRPSLTPNLLKTMLKNQKNYEKIKIFELGRIFKRTRGKIEEKRQLTLIISGEEFYYLKGVADILLNKIGISDIWYDSYKPTPEESKIAIWHLSKCAEIKIGGSEVGFLGVISQKILDKFKISKATALEIDFDLLSRFSSEEHEYRPISKFPAAVRDVAVLVPQRVLVEDVLSKIEETGGGLVRDVDLFDIYEGDEISGQKKNLAFHVIYQAEDKTFTAEEIDTIHQKITNALEKESDWRVRR